MVEVDSVSNLVVYWAVLVVDFHVVWVFKVVFAGVDWAVDWVVGMFAVVLISFLVDGTVLAATVVARA